MRLDRDGWKRTGNPSAALRNCPAARLSRLAAIGALAPELKRLMEARRAQFEGPDWFLSTPDPAGLRHFAQFSIQFGPDKPGIRYNRDHRQVGDNSSADRVLGSPRT